MAKLLGKGASDYSKMRERLEATFARAEELFRNRSCPSVPGEIDASLQVIFSSSTQAYREVLVGCTLVSLEAPSLNIRSPYVGLSDSSFNGRTLDERVVNPFLQEKRIPSSRGPFLSTFRRSVDFTPATRSGLRDKAGYDALLTLIDHVLACDHGQREKFLLKLLCRFAELRESSNIALSKLNRVSVAQYERLLAGLLKVRAAVVFL